MTDNAEISKNPSAYGIKSILTPRMLLIALPALLTYSARWVISWSASGQDVGMMERKNKARDRHGRGDPPIVMAQIPPQWVYEGYGRPTLSIFRIILLVGR